MVSVQFAANAHLLQNFQSFFLM